MENKNNHKFECVTFLHPVFCQICSKFIWGLYRQGKDCSVCKKYPIHDKCEKKAFPDCCGYAHHRVDNAVYTELKWFNSGKLDTRFVRVFPLKIFQDLTPWFQQNLNLSKYFPSSAVYIHLFHEENTGKLYSILDIEVEKDKNLIRKNDIEQKILKFDSQWKTNSLLQAIMSSNTLPNSISPIPEQNRFRNDVRNMDLRYTLYLSLTSLQDETKNLPTLVSCGIRRKQEVALKIICPYQEFLDTMEYFIKDLSLQSHITPLATLLYIKKKEDNSYELFMDKDVSTEKEDIQTRHNVIVMPSINEEKILLIAEKIKGHPDASQGLMITATRFKDDPSLEYTFEFFSFSY